MVFQSRGQKIIFVGCCSGGSGRVRTACGSSQGNLSDFRLRRKYESSGPAERGRPAGKPFGL